MLVLAGGCRAQTVRGTPTVQTAGVKVAAPDSAPWTPEERYEEIGGPWRVAHGRFEHPTALTAAAGTAVDPFAASAPEPARPPAPRPRAAPVRRKPALAVPQRRARKEARPVGKKATRSLEQLAREHFLDYPTRVKARKITIHLPAYLAHEARLTGQTVSPARGGRRQAMGGARLVLRELTLEGERVALRVRDDERLDVQIMARGDVGFVAEVRSNVLRHEGLRSLLVTNNQVVPLR